MSAEGSGSDLIQVVSLLGAAVVAVPLFKKIGLGSVLGYLAAGLAIGPFGLGLFTDPQAILHTAELGVVMFLFVIGLEMQPSHLWSLRKQIFGLGSLQCIVCGILLTLVGIAFGFSWPVAFVSAMGFVLTSTAIVMQLLGERGDIAAPRGQRMVSILLFEDLLIVPLLAIVAFMAPPALDAAAVAPSRWGVIGLALGALAALVAAGVWLLNPFFRILANAKAREVMTAAALLVVLGAALLMQLGGLSMAMGAFLAGVLLSESTFRHQLEADIEPFRGLLLGLFFLGVGMSLDLGVVATNWQLIVAGVLALMATKALCIYTVARFAKSSHADALDRAVLMAQGGEFAFVLFAAALGARVIDPTVNANMTAIVVLSMALTPLVVLAHQRWGPRIAMSMEGVEEAQDRQANVLVIGFGRVGQIASQGVVARGASLTVIDNDTEVIRTAQEYLGFKVYYGDGARADVLHAAGAHKASAILVCVDDKAAATRIAENARHACPHARVLVRAFDREHALELVKTGGADFVVRETFESAMKMGHEAVLATGATVEEADAVLADLRRLDAERFDLEVAGDAFAGRALLQARLRKKEDDDAQQAPRTDRADAAQVVAFWRDAGPAAWFTKDEAFDQRFRERFHDLHFAAAARQCDGWITEAESALALMLLLDQYPRNSFRGTGHMYATDALARMFAKQALDAGLDQQVEKDLRLFFYLPLSHSELLADQERALALNRALGDPYTEHAQNHLDIVARFGRFPHRNPMLGRETTAQEAAFLKEGGFAG